VKPTPSIAKEQETVDVFGMDYQQAHHIATHQERKAVKEAGISWNDYDEYLKPYIKEVHHEHLKVVPKDLDLTPYADEKEKDH
jgi:chorismate synthase